MTEYPHEPDPAAPVHTVMTVGPTGTGEMKQAFCRHCHQWYPRDTDQQCAHHAWTATHAP